MNPLNLLGLHHVDLRCRGEDLERSRHFWHTTLGLPVIREWATGFGVAVGGVKIYVQADDATRQGDAIHHIAFLLPDEQAVLEAARLLDEAGYEHSGLIRDGQVRNVNVPAPGGALVELRAELGRRPKEIEAGERSGAPDALA